MPPRQANAFNTRLGRPPVQVRSRTFFKTNSGHVVGTLGSPTMQCAMVDAQCAAFRLGTRDPLVLAARAVGLPLLVRVADVPAATLQSVPDLRANGFVVGSDQVLLRQASSAAAQDAREPAAVC